MKRLLLALVLTSSAAGCGPTLSRELIRNHPRIRLTVLEPQIAEQSAPVRPRWVSEAPRGAGFVAFTGQSFAPSLDDARAQATRDLYAAISSWVAVDVESEMESISIYQSAGGRTEEREELRARTKARSAAAVKGVQVDESYWEKVVSSPLLPDDASYRYFAHAKVPKAVLLRARLEAQKGRGEKTGQQVVAVLPFRPALATPDLSPLADAFAEELSRRLASQPGLQVSDPELVRTLAAGGAEAEALDAVRGALAPDRVVGGSYQLHRDRLKVSYSIYGSLDEGVVATGAVERAYAELFALQDDLLAALGAALPGVKTAEHGALPETERRDPTRAAFEAYAAAGASFRAGDNQAAVAKLLEAITLEPSYAAAYLRLGRVYDRLGRLGRLPPREVASGHLDPPVLCVPRGALPPLAVHGARESNVTPGAPTAGEDLDEVLSAVLYADGGELIPSPEVGPRPASAAGAYWLAYRHAREAGDRRLTAEVRLALGDLARRADRLDPAAALFARVLADALAERAPALQSLAHYGLGQVDRDRGDLSRARASLLAALKLRLVSLEKPYLLEIYNELGGVAVARGANAEARAHFERALALAEELDDAYFRAVVGNNLGLLELTEGRTARAEERFAVAWRLLSDLGETEGQIATALNLAMSGGLRGDLERARAYLDEARRLTSATGQEGRRAQLLEQDGALALRGGAHREALIHLLRAHGLHQRLGRHADAWRTESGILAAQLGMLAQGSAIDPGCLHGAARQTLARAGLWAWALEERQQQYWRRRARWLGPPQLEREAARVSTEAEITRAHVELNGELIGRVR